MRKSRDDYLTLKTHGEPVELTFKELSKEVSYNLNINGNQRKEKPTNGNIVLELKERENSVILQLSD